MGIPLIASLQPSTSLLNCSPYSPYWVTMKPLSSKVNSLESRSKYSALSNPFSHATFLYLHNHNLFQSLQQILWFSSTCNQLTTIPIVFISKLTVGSEAYCLYCLLPSILPDVRKSWRRTKKSWLVRTHSAFKECVRGWLREIFEVCSESFNVITYQLTEPSSW